MVWYKSAMVTENPSIKVVTFRLDKLIGVWNQGIK
jgi:hypothetical protein